MYCAIDIQYLVEISAPPDGSSNRLSLKSALRETENYEEYISEIVPIIGSCMSMYNGSTLHYMYVTHLIPMEVVGTLSEDAVGSPAQL